MDLFSESNHFSLIQTYRKGEAENKDRWSRFKGERIAGGKDYMSGNA